MWRCVVLVLGSYILNIPNTFRGTPTVSNELCTLLYGIVQLYILLSSLRPSTGNGEGHSDPNIRTTHQSTEARCRHANVCAVLATDLKAAPGNDPTVEATELAAALALQRGCRVYRTLA